MNRFSRKPGSRANLFGAVCSQCEAYQPDAINPPAGLGKCLAGVVRETPWIAPAGIGNDKKRKYQNCYQLPWPNAPACPRFRQKNKQTNFAGRVGGKGA